MELPRGGAAPSEKKSNTPKEEGKPQKRRGRKGKLAQKFGENDFVAQQDDIDDMAKCYKRCLKGPTTIPDAHKKYLAKEFKDRHPEIYAEYVKGKRSEPVTEKQYRYYVKLQRRLFDDLADNMRTHKKERALCRNIAGVRSGRDLRDRCYRSGRLFLLSSSNPPAELKQPDIYFIIDRWSRYIPSIYITLRSPSYEELRFSLLIAFTPRGVRFRALGIDIDDERWPFVPLPLQLCADRGSDFLNRSIKKALVDDMDVPLRTLPPFCPDGKAIVERMIRELKKKIAENMRGTYADRPTKPQQTKNELFVKLRQPRSFLYQRPTVS